MNKKYCLSYQVSESETDKISNAQSYAYISGALKKIGGSINIDARGILRIEIESIEDSEVAQKACTVHHYDQKTNPR